jgi:hypothetical protein
MPFLALALAKSTRSISIASVITPSVIAHLVAIGKLNVQLTPHRFLSSNYSILHSSLLFAPTSRSKTLNHILEDDVLDLGRLCLISTTTLSARPAVEANLRGHDVQAALKSSAVLIGCMHCYLELVSSGSRPSRNVAPCTLLRPPVVYFHLVSASIELKSLS